MPPPPPKSSAPAPPKAKAPPPPPGASKPKSKSKPKPKPKSTTSKPKSSYNTTTKKNSSDSTYDLGKKAATEAGSAAKIALFSLGSKLKKDMKSFTKSELDHAGVDTTKPIIKKPNIIKKVKQSKPAPPPAELKSVNIDWKHKNVKNTNKNGYNNNNKNKNTKRKAPPPNNIKKNKSAPSNLHNLTKNTKKNGKKNGLSNRVKMFEANDTNKNKNNRPKSNGFFKNKNNNKRDKNLKPSLIKSKKKSPPLKSKAPPPNELKSVNVDWKQQKKKMANVFKKKEEDKNKESKIKVKSKEIMSSVKKMKASVTAETVDPNKPKPKKLEFKLFKKSKSVEVNEKKQDGKTQIKPPPPPKQMKFSKSADIQSKMVPPPVPTNALEGSRITSEGMNSTGNNYNVVTVNKKVARPEDYNEIQFKAVDPMALRRKQKRQGIAGGRHVPRITNMVKNTPTNANNLNDTNGNVKVIIANKNMNNKKKKPKPALPSGPPPKPKPKGVKKGIEKRGVLEIMPSKSTNGWVYNEGGMYMVQYNQCINDIKSNGIFEGYPVVFEYVDKKVKKMRLLKQIDSKLVKECMNKKGKTKYDAKYYIKDTQFEFNGNLSCNAFEMPKDCSPKQVGIMSEKIVNAFMNTSGGVLYIGIDNNWNIKGVKSKNIDMIGIKQCVMMNVNRFKPTLNSNDFKKFKFTTTAMVRKDGVLCQDVIIIKIIVPGPFKNGKNDNIIFQTGNGDKYKKNLNYIMKVVM